MSILEFNEKEKVCIISHEKFVKDVYSNRKLWTGEMDIFDIKTPFRMDLEAENVAKRMESGENGGHPKKKKRKLDLNEFMQTEITLLNEKFLVFLRMSHFLDDPSVEDIRHNNRTLRENVKSLLTTVQNINLPDLGKNTSDNTVDQHGVILPPKSEFWKLNVENLDDLGSSTFDVILMDPPWSNKHVKRVKRTGVGYDMMHNDNLENMPVDKLLNDDGLVFVWCTNKLKHRVAVKAWFLSWGVTMIGTWYWVKVTKHGELVTQFSQDKQPYEVVLIGQKCSEHVLKDVRDGLVIVSVPSGIHSHKPPLTDLIKTVLGQQVDRSWEMLDKLEIFGRYLLPGWVTVGNQPCLLNISAIKS